MSATSFFGVLLLAGTVVLIVGWTGAHFLRRQAAWENALWRTVLLVLLALPVAQMAGPYVTRPSKTEENRRGEAAAAVVMNDSAFAGAGIRAPSAVPAKVGNAWPTVWRSLLWIWGAGLVVSLVGLARSVWKVHRWVQAAVPVVSEGHAVLANGAHMAGVRPPELRVALGLHGPVLVGWWRPCILVPSMEVAQQREVLLHELAHLRRADLWWMTLGRIVGAGWWFHPLAWSAGRRLERSAENVCDDLVVIWTQDAAAYAGQLMRFARQTGGAGWWPLAGAAITGFRSELGKRVERVLEPNRVVRVAAGRGAVASLAAGAALLLALLAAVSPSRGQSGSPASESTASAQTPVATVVVGDEAARAVINHKLTSIIVPNLEFRRTTLSDGIEFLRQESRRLDTDPDKDKRGVNIVIPPQSPVPKDSKERINLSIDQVPLIEALRQVARQNNLHVVIEPYLVRLVPVAPGNGGATAGVVSPQASAEAATTEKQHLAALNHKLTSIIVPNLEFRRTTLSDGIEFLRQESRRLDTDPDKDKRGVNIVLAVPVETADKRVTLSLSNVPLIEALRFVVGQADLQVVLEPYTAVVETKDP